MTQRIGPGSSEDPVDVETVIVGTGFAGLGAAIKLREAGHRDLVLLERGDTVGGIWRDNSYPGCACDVPSDLYSFSFAPNPRWRHAFSRQPQIRDYLEGVAQDYGLLPAVRFGADVTAMTWDDDAQRWLVTSTAGTWRCRFLVLGTGGLSDPSVPDLPGLETFTGTTFHSATWNHDHDLTGRRVAVVGTGASAIQFVPHVQQRAEHLTLFQRSAPWVLPRRDRAYRSWERLLRRVFPGLQRSFRLRIYLLRELTVVALAKRPSLLRHGEKLAVKRLHEQVPDPQLRRALTPTFRLGCKRVLLSNDFYPALTQPNVTVETGRIVEVTPSAVVTATEDGTRREHDVDTIIFGTGFRIRDLPVAHRVTGSDDRTLAEHWADTGMAALHGTTVAGFPNLFFLVGPNTGLGHTSIVLMIEAQLRYLVDMLDRAQRAGIESFQPRRAAQDAHNERLQRMLSRTVWNTGGCDSWYLDRHGRNTTLWPTFTFSFMRQMRGADLAEYDVTRRTSRRETVPA
jgi:cation diffusion facilitator CzcD-associated flavoprotein CzcO